MVVLPAPVWPTNGGRLSARGDGEGDSAEDPFDVGVRLELLIAAGRLIDEKLIFFT